MCPTMSSTRNCQPTKLVWSLKRSRHALPATLIHSACVRARECCLIQSTFVIAIRELKSHTEESQYAAWSEPICYHYKDASSIHISRLRFKKVLAELIVPPDVRRIRFKFGSI
jgi:hypothetical protein